MTADPDEGVAPDGTITTGVSRSRTPTMYRPLVDDAVRTLQAELGPHLHGLYLYGSVAIGRAHPPGSDLDLLVVTTDDQSGRCGALQAALSRRHAGVVREVGLAVGTVAEFTAPGREAHANRCFLRHYCVHLAGIDLRPDLPPCRPDRRLAADFAGDLQALADDLPAALAVHGPAKVARRLLMAAATLLSVEQGTWSTDRARGAVMAATRRPDLAGAVAVLERWAALDHQPDAPVPDAARVLATAAPVARWLCHLRAAAG